MPAPGRATAPSCHGRCRAAGARRGGAGRRLQELRAGWRGAVRGRPPARRRRQEVTEGRRGAGPAPRLPRGAAVSQPGHRRRDGTGRGAGPASRRSGGGGLWLGAGQSPDTGPAGETDGEPACSGRPPPARLSARCAGCTPGRGGAERPPLRAGPGPRLRGAIRSWRTLEGHLSRGQGWQLKAHPCDVWAVVSRPAHGDPEGRAGVAQS